MAGVAGALYVPQVGIINPSEFAPGNSIEAVIWVAVGGRGTLVGAALGALVVNYAKTTVHLRRAGALLAVRSRQPVRAGARCCCRAASSARSITTGRSGASSPAAAPAPTRGRNRRQAGGVRS